MSLRRCAVLIAGATASGKSALAIEMARARNGVVINADALQVYRELCILTARPSPEEEASLPHRLYGYVAGTERFSVARWLADARDMLDEAWTSGRLPIIAGGTGLYFRFLEQGLAEVPPVPLELREAWLSFKGDLHAELARRDSASAARLHPNDRQRLIRALEVIDGTGRPLSAWQSQAKAKAPLAGIALERHFLDVPRAELQERAAARFDRMIELGALDEVRPLLGWDACLPLMKAIGVSELAAHLRGEMPLDKAVAAAKTATRQYIKRQLTWWRGQGGRHWRAPAE